METGNKSSNKGRRLFQIVIGAMEKVNRVIWGEWEKSVI